VKDKISVSVVVPLRNEEAYIEKCIESLLAQDFPREQTQLIFVDGDSADRTREIIKRYIEQWPSLISLRDNPARTVPCAMNIGIRAAAGKYIVRIDAHSEYAEDYISQCVHYLEKTGAANVGGPMRATGKSFIQSVVAAAYYSPFALGGGRFHDEKYEGWADTVYLGAFRKEVLLAAGLFDENFTRNQDDELNYRIIKSGGKIFLTPQIKSLYYPRASLRKLFSQYFQYGRWKTAVIKKHGRPARPTHLAPAAFVVFLLGGGTAALVFRPLAPVYAGVLALYFLLNLFFSCTNRRAAGPAAKLLLTWVHFILHISYGLGFISGLPPGGGKKAPAREGENRP
jgi:glycosyltransferase involved in cell wall biosynthesis